MRGRRIVAGALTKRAMVAALTMSSVFVVVAPTAPTVQAYNGGTSYAAAAAMPCTPDCEFIGDNTGGGLTSFPYGGYQNYLATWWSFTAPATKDYTFSAASISPAEWDNTLTLTAADGTVIAHSDDFYDLDAMLSAPLTSGTSYRLALAGFHDTAAGTATITISSSPPDAPTDLVGVEGDGQVSLTWTAPFDHYAAITDYKVYVVDTAIVETISGTPPVTELTIGGLTNGVEYSFEVTAVNLNGESEPSIESATYVPYGNTTTSIAFDPANPTYGSSFDVVVTVAGSSTVNSGTVTLYRGATNLGTHDVVGGTATWTESNRPAGSQNYTAQYSGAAAWTSSSASPTGVTVSKAEQTITFAQPADATHATGSVTLAPSSTSLLAVALTSGTTSVCTVSGFVVTLVTGGTCTLTASQAGNGNYLAATSVERSFQVTEAPQTITFAQPADRAWSASTFAVAPTSSSGLTVTLTSGTQSVCTVSGFTVTMVRTGTCTLTAAHAGDTNFVAASLPRSFQITGATQSALTTIADSYELFVGGTTDVDTNGGSGTGAVTYAVTSGADHCTLDDTVLTATSGGTCVVTGTKAADNHYASASDATNVITVTKEQPTIAIAGTASVHSGDTATVTVTVTDLVDGFAPGAVSLQLSGATTGALVDPSSASLVVAGDGMSGTASFTVTAGVQGTLEVNARMASTPAYEQADTASPAVLTVTAAPAPPGPPAALIPTVPTRIIDTRPGYPHVRPAPDRVLAAGEVLEVQFTDLPGLVPASGVSAVALDIGVVAPDGDGYITAYPCGDRPTVSSLNFRSAETTSNAAIVPVNDSTGAVCFSASRATHLIVDITGWFATGNGFVDAAPSRLVDTRPGHVALRPLTGSFGTDQVREVTVTDIPGLVPAQGVAAVSLNLTVVNPTGAGYVSAYACGERPNASSVNFGTGRTVANLAIVPVSASGTVCFYASQSLHLVIDLTGWFEVGHGFDASGPARVLDTRPGYSGLRTVTSERIGGATMLTVKVTDLAGLVPADGVGAVSLNVTAIDPEGDGFLTVWACGTRPDASSLNFAAHRTTAGAVIAPVDAATGTVCFYSSQNVHLAVDLNGWFVGNVT
ncbi:MAG: Ig-like domain repeat protein [Actinobacteria bacterium]|nr:Ig-like domain repeat protein [Actinomycetota bacterium]